MSVSHSFGTEFPLNVLEMATSRDTHTQKVTLGSSTGFIVARFAPLVGFLCSCHSLLFIYMPARPLLLLPPLPPSPLPFSLSRSFESFNLHAIIYFDRYQRMNLIPFTVCHPSIAQQNSHIHKHSSLARSNVFSMRDWREWEEYTISM